MGEQNKLATLTPRQRDIFEFLKDKILNRGFGPTVREIGNEFGIKSPNGVMCHLKALEKKGLILREANMSRAIQLADKPKRETTLPLLGQISQGTPLSPGKDGDIVDFLDVLGSGDHICVQVADDSMSGDGIYAGDFVLVRKQSACRDGDKVLVLIDGRNAAVKRYYTDPKGVRLEPLTSSKKPVTAAHVNVLGVVLGVVRKL